MVVREDSDNDDDIRAKKYRLCVIPFVSVSCAQSFDTAHMCDWLRIIAPNPPRRVRACLCCKCRVYVHHDRCRQAAQECRQRVHLDMGVENTRGASDQYIARHSSERGLSNRQNMSYQTG